MIFLIIDCHCHVFRDVNSRDVLNNTFNRFQGYGFFEHISEKMAEIKSFETKDIIEKTVFHIKRANIEKVVLLPLSTNENEIVQEWAKRHPDIFIPFFNPPERPSERESVEQVVERAVINDQVKGLKIMLPFRRKKLNDKTVFPALEVASSHKIPVLMHTGYPPPGTTRDVLTYSDPVHVEEVVNSFPTLSLILAHMGYPWVDMAIALATQYPSIYLDVSNLTYMMPSRLKELLIQAREIIGVNKILFGSDGFCPEMIEIAVDYFMGTDFLKPMEIEKILGLNAAKILNML